MICDYCRYLDHMYRNGSTTLVQCRNNYTGDRTVVLSTSRENELNCNRYKPLTKRQIKSKIKMQRLYESLNKEDNKDE